ncbi:hypothetical protein [Endozoicomonas sp. ALB115]|uniref:hypothetical protein n=1 Tax=Endozoicomonas sp. ALB115 TaxID=3403074 RepID=UPI003BB5A7BF
MEDCKSYIQKLLMLLTYAVSWFAFQCSLEIEPADGCRLIYLIYLCAFIVNICISDSKWKVVGFLLPSLILFFGKYVMLLGMILPYIIAP